MIRRIQNLICPLGHRHYSPTPEAFDGRMCFQPLGVDSTKRKCQERLSLIRKEK